MDAKIGKTCQTFDDAIQPRCSGTPSHSWTPINRTQISKVANLMLPTQRAVVYSSYGERDIDRGKLDVKLRRQHAIAVAEGWYDMALKVALFGMLASPFQSPEYEVWMELARSAIQHADLNKDTYEELH